MKRVTPESAARLVAIYAARAGLTGRRAPARDWTFSVKVVPGLSHPGEDGKPAPAWAVVEPKVNPVDPKARVPYPGGAAHVRVRDIDATPIPGFDGDPLFELRVTLAHETQHCVYAEAVAAHGEGTVAAEEQIVEAAAQAIVRSEGTADARVMARVAREMPERLRARISASAGQRARGAKMDPNMVKDALDKLVAGDAEGCMEILKGLIASAASGGAAAPVEEAPESTNEPPPMEAREEPMENDPNKPKPGATPAARPAARVDPARARQKAEDDAITEFRRNVAKDDLIGHVRARLADHPGLAAVEKRITAAPDFITAKAAADLALEMVGAGPARARTETRPATPPAPTTTAKPKYNEADLLKEGIHPLMAKDIASETDERIAAVAYEAARARITQGGSPWPTAAKPAGGAS